jgi:hypothetical protein
MYPRPSDYWQTCQKHTLGEKTAFLTNGAEKAGYPHMEDWN